MTFLDTTEFLDTHVCINNPHWQSSGIIIFLYKYDAAIYFSWICSSSRSLQYYQSFIRNQEGKIELQKKVHRRICVSEITFLTARSSFYVFFCWSLSSPSPFPIDVLDERTLWRYTILQWLVFCVMIPWVNCRKSSLETWY